MLETNTAAFVNELYKFQTNLRTLILFPYQYIIIINIANINISQSIH